MSGIYFNFLSKKMALGVRTQRMEEHHMRACVRLCFSVHVSVCVCAGWVCLYSRSWRSPQRQAGCPSVCRHDRLRRGYVETSLCTYALSRYLNFTRK